MRGSTLARGTATALCGLWLVGVPSMAQETEQPEERVETVRLVAGEMQIVTTYKADEKNAKVRFKGQEFDLGYGGALHHKTFRLRDREIVIVESWGDVRGMPPDHDVFSVGRRGSVEHIKNKEFSTSDGTFSVIQKANTLYFNLGYEQGLKKDAILSAAGLRVSKKPVARPAFDNGDCKWLYEQALDDCVVTSKVFTRPCDEVFHPMATERGFNSLRENPRWRVAEGRVSLVCKKACEAKRPPARAEFRKDVCGP